jgi:uncharacterized protein YgbK (DUF1537 family)
MPRLTVIADDFTGAAEIAAIALDHGLSTQILREPTAIPHIDAIVFDTDTRARAPAEAARKVAPFAAIAREAELIFKKTDSVLRGPVRAELESILAATARRRCLLVPQNPGKGRVIIGGRYQINGQDISQTPFATDPLHPVTTSDVIQMVGENGPFPIHYAAPGSILPKEGLLIAGGSTQPELNRWARQIDAETLPAGGAEFFAAMLAARGFKNQPTAHPAELTGSLLAVCGSTAGSSRTTHGSLFLPIPDDDLARDSTQLEQWKSRVREMMRQSGAAFISTPLRLHVRPDEIEKRLADMVGSIVASYRPRWILIEGGQTASAIISRMNWTRFSVHGQFAPGVGHLRPMAADAPDLVVKPGSYPWPLAVLQRLLANLKR